MAQRIIRRDELLMLVGLSDATIWRMEKAGRFPRRIQLGRNSVGWLSDEVDAWMREKASNRDQNEPYRAGGSQDLSTELPFELMSIRLYNCLKNMNINTYEELSKNTRADLLRAHNFGRKSLSELEALVNDKRLNCNNCLLKPEPPRTLPPIKERILLALKMHSEGAKYREIGAALSVSKERARQIIAKGERQVALRERYLQRTKEA